MADLFLCSNGVAGEWERIGSAWVRPYCLCSPGNEHFDKLWPATPSGNEYRRYENIVQVAKLITKRSHRDHRSANSCQNDPDSSQLLQFVTSRLITTALNSVMLAAQD